MAYEGPIEKFAPVEVDEADALILKARGLISDPKLWCKCVPKDGDRLCILGALSEAANVEGGAASYPPAFVEAVERITLAIDNKPVTPMWARYRRITAFNDEIDTTHADVLALLDRAAQAKPKPE